MGRVDVEDGAEVDDERLRVRPLGGRGAAPLFEELGWSHVTPSVADVRVRSEEYGRLRVR